MHMDMNRILKVSQENHSLLQRKLASQKELAGKWVGVAKQRIVYDTQRDRVVRKLDSIQPKKELQLIAKIEKGRKTSIAF
jgi:hypothetical protein